MMEDRSVGTLLGVTCGDILGAPIKGMEATVIIATHGKISDFLDVEGKYTDDTQLTIALADSLVEHKKISLEHVPTKYTDYYNPLRGYAESQGRALDAIAEGISYDETGRVAFRGGSFGSGGSTRIAPIGIVYRNATDDVLHKAVVDAVLCTHTHPDSVDGAFVQAKAVAILVKTDVANFNPEAFLKTLHGVARTEALKTTITKALHQIGQTTTTNGTGSDDVIIGNGIAATDAIGSALVVFGRMWKSPEEALISAVALGGDTDTIAAHTGALIGALHGSAWIPKRWYDKIENGKHGRDFIIQLAKRLSSLDVTDSEGKGEQILKKQDEVLAKGGEFGFEQERNQHVQDILDKIDVKIQRITSK